MLISGSNPPCSEIFIIANCIKQIGSSSRCQGPFKDWTGRPGPHRFSSEKAGTDTGTPPFNARRELRFVTRPVHSPLFSPLLNSLDRNATIVRFCCCQFIQCQYIFAHAYNGGKRERLHLPIPTVAWATSIGSRSHDGIGTYLSINSHDETGPTAGTCRSPGSFCRWLRIGLTLLLPHPVTLIRKCFCFLRVSVYICAIYACEMLEPCLIASSHRSSYA